MSPSTVEAELVEALPFLPVEEKEPFDQLRTNGCPGDIRENELKTNGCPGDIRENELRANG